MQYVNIQKNVGHSPRKVRLVADMVRKMSPEQALLTLKFVNRAAAADLAKAIQTAIANSGGRTNLRFATLEVNEGLKMRRFRAGSKGRAKPYKRRLSHIKIILTDEANMNAKLPTAAIKQAISQKVEDNTVPVEALTDIVANSEVGQETAMAQEPTREADVIEAEIVEEPKKLKNKKGEKVS